MVEVLCSSCIYQEIYNWAENKCTRYGISFVDRITYKCKNKEYSITQAAVVANTMKPCDDRIRIASCKTFEVDFWADDNCLIRGTVHHHRRNWHKNIDGKYSAPEWERCWFVVQHYCLAINYLMQSGFVTGDWFVDHLQTRLQIARINIKHSTDSKKTILVLQALSESFWDRQATKKLVMFGWGVVGPWNFSNFFAVLKSLHFELRCIAQFFLHLSRRVCDLWGFIPPKPILPKIWKLCSREEIRPIWLVLIMWSFRDRIVRSSIKFDPSSIMSFSIFFALTQLDNALIDFGYSNTVKMLSCGLSPGF